MSYLDNNGLLYLWDKIKALVGTKVDKETGKGLSSNDYTTTEKNKLSGIATGANKYVLPKATTSTLGGVKVDGTTVTVDSTGKISASPGADYIVEEGTSGNWKYTKWNNGRLELINYSYELSNLSFVAWGNLYYTSPWVSLPDGFIYYIVEYYVNVLSNQNKFMVAGIPSPGRWSFQLRLVAPDTSTTSTTVCVQLIGKWK